MVAAFLAVRNEAPGRVTGAVFQGQGEPLANYDEVMRAARVLKDPCGGQVTAAAITISTVGLVPQIRRYTAERQPYRLIVSLVSAIPEKRARLLPVAGRGPLADLAAALREHAAAIRGRLTVAWVLISGVNTGADEVAALAALLGDLPLRVNLIDVNDPRPDGFRRASDAERRAFVERLQVLKVPVVRRYSGGVATHAACGMLVAKRVGHDGGAR
jgi:23S rRNA (adenine2503-C2)-methyltransferase